MALWLIQHVCLWHSWTTCLRTESFLKPSGLQDLRIFLRPIFFSGVQRKTQCIRTIPTQGMSWRWPSQNTFGMWTVLYWTRSSRTQFGVSINVWRLAGDTLNITCNFLYCNHHMHRDFLITLHIQLIPAPLPAGNNTTKIKIHNIKQTTHQQPTSITLTSRMVPAAHKVDKVVWWFLCRKEERKEKNSIF